jgi:hypothetical protein
MPFDMSMESAITRSKGRVLANALRAGFAFRSRERPPRRSAYMEALALPLESGIVVMKLNPNAVTELVLARVIAFESDIPPDTPSWIARKIACVRGVTAHEVPWSTPRRVSVAARDTTAPVASSV